MAEDRGSSSSIDPRKPIQGKGKIGRPRLKLDISETLADGNLRDLVKVQPKLPIGSDLPVRVIRFIGHWSGLPKAIKSRGGVFEKMPSQS